MKTCFKCGQEKPASSFYRHPRMKDGRLGKCMECTKVDVTNNRDARLEAIREYDRRRGNRRTPAQQRTYRERNREKLWAQRKVKYAIQKGYMTREPCEECGVFERVHAHHDDYSKPLDIRWLCPKHHAQHHKGRKID